MQWRVAVFVDCILASDIFRENLFNDADLAFICRPKNLFLWCFCAKMQENVVSFSSFRSTQGEISRVCLPRGFGVSKISSTGSSQPLTNIPGLTFAIRNCSNWSISSSGSLSLMFPSICELFLRLIWKAHLRHKI